MKTAADGGGLIERGRGTYEKSISIISARNLAVCVVLVSLHILMVLYLLQINVRVLHLVGRSILV